MPVTIEFSERLKQLPPYLFLEIDKAKRAAMAAGRDVIDLGIGDPDTGTPQQIIDALKEAAQNPANHHYAFDAGMPELRRQISVWFKKRFKVDLNPDTEIYPVIGSKEGLSHLPMGIVNPKDKVIVPDPSYPGYPASVIFAGGKVVSAPLKERNGFLPDLNKIKDLSGVKMMFVNYPNNPTAAVATQEFYTELVSIARDKGMILVSDMAYSEIYYDNEKPLSILEIEGAKEVAIEFHSFSKTYSMTGWRIGWACGNPTLIAALGKVKSNVDSGIFQAIQIAGMRALQLDELEVQHLREMYQERRDALINGLRSIGWKIPSPKATFYVWGKIPKKFSNSMAAAQAFLDEADIVATPGVGFGKSAEGYIRMTITMPKERINEAVERLRKVL